MSHYYRPGEVLWLLSLTREEAIDQDASPHDSCSSLSGDMAGNSSEETGIPVIVRWHDVRAARERVKQRKGMEQIIRFRAAGFTEEEVARIVGVGRLNVHRRLHVGLEELVEELGAREQPDATPVVPLCLIAGCEQPRARLVVVKRRIKGGWRIVKPERTAAVCREHLSAELRSRAAA